MNSRINSGLICADKPFSFDLVHEGKAVVEDIEIGEAAIGFFGEERLGDAHLKAIDQIVRTHRPVVHAGLKEGFGVVDVDRAVAEIIIEVLESDIAGEEDYSGLFTRLGELSREFLDTGRFEDLLNIYNFVYPHTLSGGFRSEASELIRYFHSDKFIAKFVGSFRIWGKRESESMVRLAKVLKRYLIQPLIDALLDEPGASVRKLLLSALSELGKDVAPEAAKRLDDARWYVIRNMLCLIRESGDKKYEEQARRFLTHGNEKVRAEAVKTILKFNAPDAFGYIKPHLQSEDPDIRNRAITLSGAYRVKEAVPYLLDMLGRKDLLGTDLRFKMFVVKALGEIGAPSAVETLAKICGSKPLLNRDKHDELKLGIFRSLGNYPLDSLKPLLAIGLRLENAEIRGLSEKLARDGRRDDKG